MLKSEALGQLSTISAQNDRRFEDFVNSYRVMKDIVGAFPELSDYVLPIVRQTAADNGFNPDVRPEAVDVFTAAAANVSAEKVLKEMGLAFERVPSFAFALMPELLKTQPQLSSALFDLAINKISTLDANRSYPAFAGIKAAMLNASDRETAEMLAIVFAPGAEEKKLAGMFYCSLGQIYVQHPKLKEQIFSLLENPEYLTPQRYDALFANLGQIALFDTAERERALTLIGAYAGRTDNTPASMAAAYKAIGGLLPDADPKLKNKLEQMLRNGLENPANNKASQKAAWRLLGDYDNLCSNVLFYRRGEKSEENEFGLKKQDNIDADEVCVLVLGGDGTRTEKVLNGYLSNIYRLLRENDLHEKAAVLGVVYDFGEYMNVNYARSSQMEKYGRKIRLNRELTPDTLNPKYVREIFNKAVLPRISTDGGKQRLNAAEAAARIRRLNIVAHCHGAYTALMLEQMMQTKMEELGYSRQEKKFIQKQLMVVAQSPYCPLGQSQSTFVSFASVKDDEVSHYNNFEAAVRKINDRQNIPLSYFPDRQGNIFLVGDMGKEFDQHNFWGYHPSSEMTREGQALIALSAKMLVGGVKNALSNNSNIPEIEHLAADTEESKKLFKTICDNGREIYAQITAESIARRKVFNHDR